VLETLRPYITTRGETQARINLNAAPEPVLRALPGMNDVILAQILSLRSQGRRITSVQQVMTNATRVPAGRGGRGDQRQQQVERVTQQLTERTTVNTTDIELTFLVRDTSRVQPTRLVAIVTRGNGNRASVTWQLW
jgi:type II secretory pathway component PulK